MKYKKPYIEVTVISKKFSKSLKFVGFVLICALALGLITYGIVALVKIFSGNKIGGNEIFCVYIMLDATDNQSAENETSELKARGGAGVAIRIDNGFGAVLAVYTSNNDAETVVQQLKEQNFNAKIFSINTPTIRLDNLDTEQKEIAQNINEKYFETIESLYDISTKLDTNILTESQAIMRINELALLWTQRAENIAYKIDTSQNSDKDSTPHPLYATYNLALSVASQLNYLATENTHSDSLKTFVSVIRQVNYTLVTIDVEPK